MRFELLPILDQMLDLYQKPRGFERFKEYLKTLQGDTEADLAIPISGFNPMAKEHILDKLGELKALDIEKIMENALLDLNKKLQNHNEHRFFKLAFNLADDLKGGWTNRYTSDYDSKFKIQALLKRGFCVPIFWASEAFSQSLILERTLEYAYRSIYWLQNPKPQTLQEHLQQEIFVAQNIQYQNSNFEVDFKEMHHFYTKNQQSDNYHLIFNFFYGNNATQSLGFSTFATFDTLNGFAYARYLANPL
ncbi:MAG: hypothetical protein MUE85_06795 [Microscillaceae bacterium]|jgi:hypothetical protein|nr:hypothetical protein [Microscillaceae bacterium]